MNNDEILYDTIKTLRFKLLELEKENRILKNDAIFYESRINKLEFHLDNYKAQLNDAREQLLNSAPKQQVLYQPNSTNDMIVT
ncbi:MAG: hypothetical protein IPL34_20380 [Thiofilum sp.]|uniref:hypothetical protein n=1 Tax=Thiofilum sp. TaxID=2212733 RepID=UPI0025D02693|nr:hypothetical protein [Thiofilum sp.]MBK8455640.1 hypothetical protein [Thiofilum sp.]